MKLYEKMGIELNKEGFKKLFELTCSRMPDEYDCEYNCRYPSESDACYRCKAERLFAEVPVKKVPRVATINTADELKQTLIDLNEFCSKNGGCHDCIYGDEDETCFYFWLSEEIEVPE